MLRRSALLLACLLAAAPALAADPPIASSRKALVAFNMLDAQGNGMVDQSEFLHGRPFARQVFTALDRNGDGVIDRREFLANQAAQRASEFALLDRNHDGKLTLVELQRGWTIALFNALSGGRETLMPGDLWPGLTTYTNAPPTPPTAPEVGTTTATAGPCWIPLMGDDPDQRHHWGMVMPWATRCR